MKAPKFLNCLGFRCICEGGRNQELEGIAEVPGEGFGDDLISPVFLRDGGASDFLSGGILAVSVLSGFLCGFVPQ